MLSRRKTRYVQQYGDSLKIINRATIWSSNFTLGLYPEKTIIQRIHPPLFTAAIFTTAKTWTQSKWPSTEKWIKKMWYMWNVYRLKMEYCPGTKKNKIMSFAVTWMNLEIVLMTEVSQTEQDKYHILLICRIFFF